MESAAAGQARRLVGVQEGRQHEVYRGTVGKECAAGASVTWSRYERTNWVEEVLRRGRQRCLKREVGEAGRAPC